MLCTHVYPLSFEQGHSIADWEAYNFIMTFETTYKRIVPYRWLATQAVIVINPFVLSAP